MAQAYWTAVREERQAEFLVHEFFPWTAVVEIGAMTQETAECAQAVFAAKSHQPLVAVRRECYY